MGGPGEIQISDRDVLHIVQRHYHELNEKNLEILNYNLSPFSNDTQGFLSNHRFLSVLVKHKTKDGVIEEKLKFFTKLEPANSEALSKYVEDFNVFEKESNVYRFILPRLQAINMGVEFAAKCFMAQNKYLVFENLVDKDFRLGSTPGTILDYEHLRVALKSLASMHSASIILENRTKKSLPELYTKCLVENSYPEGRNNLRLCYVKTTIETICSFVPLITKYGNSPQLKTIVEKFGDVLRRIFIFARTSEKYRNVLCHGDLWANNILFRYENSKPTECRLVDFQLARYAPPMMDILTVLTIPTTSSFRNRSLNDLLEEYYNFMKDFLGEHNINIEDEIPRKEFNESAEYFKLAGLIESCLFSHITLLPPDIADSIHENSEDFQQFFSRERISMCAKAFKSDRIYSERLTDMISEVIDNYVLVGELEDNF